MKLPEMKFRIIFTVILVSLCLPKKKAENLNFAMWEDSLFLSFLLKH